MSAAQTQSQQAPRVVAVFTGWPRLPTEPERQAEVVAIGPGGAAAKPHEPDLVAA